jgi:hypothetical protein
MGIDSIKYETGGEINWDSLSPCKTMTYAGSCYGGAWRERNDDAYILFSKKKDLTEQDRERLFRMLDAQACYSYAMEVVKGRWEKGEDKILNSSKFCYLYSLNVIKGRWEDAEDKIANNYFSSLAYAKNVLKGRFPGGERWIFKKKFILGGGAMEGSEFFWSTGAPGDSCTYSLDGWRCYDGLEAKDVYVIELMGKRDEKFENKIMRSKSSKYEKIRTKMLLSYMRNCPGGRLPENMHEHMLCEALKKDEHAVKYCETFPDDLLKARTLGFAPAPVKRASSKEKFTDEMKEQLESLVKKEITTLFPGWYTDDEWEDHREKANGFLVSIGCETRTRSYRVKKHYPRVGVWEFNDRRTRGLVWLEYERGRYHMGDCYWVGIPEDIARRSLVAGKFPS